MNSRKIKTVPHLRTGPQQQDQRWKRPELGTLKLNVDASVKQGQSSFAIGMVLRNHEGHYISGKTARFQGSTSVVEAEIVLLRVTRF